MNVIEEIAAANRSFEVHAGLPLSGVLAGAGLCFGGEAADALCDSALTNRGDMAAAELK